MFYEVLRNMCTDGFKVLLIDHLLDDSPDDIALFSKAAIAPDSFP
jgi:hypothetical protein